MKMKKKKARGTYFMPTFPELQEASHYLISVPDFCSHRVQFKAKMAEFEESPMAYEETKYRAKVELHDLSEESFIERKYMGTDTDRHDMIVLGRKQVLRVCRITVTPPESEWHRVAFWVLC